MWSILLEERAYQDIKVATQYYESRQKGLGLKFKTALKLEFDSLTIFYKFQIRYNQVRVKKINKFPYLIHFICDEEKSQIKVLAIISTYLNPEKNWII